jgi:hypothetical protein
LVIPKFKKKKVEKLAKELNAAKGINGVRYLIQKYLPVGFRMALTRQSPEFFLLYYLGFRLPDHQRKWIKLWTDTDYLLHLAPRDHGKSWIYSYGMPLYDIYESYIYTGFKQVTSRLLGISKTDGQAEKFAIQIKETIERNDYLLRDFGDIRDPKRWYQTLFRCKRDWSSGSVEKDYTYESVGVLGAITGGHFSRIIGDDLLDDENTKTVERMMSISNWFWGTIWNLREAGTRFTIVGTRKNRKDLYSEIMEKPTWKFVKEKAIIVYPMIPNPEKPGEMKQGWVYKTTKARWIEGLKDLHPDGEKIEGVKILTDDYQVLWPSSVALDGGGDPIYEKDGRPRIFGWGMEELLLDLATQGDTYFAREKQNEISAESGSIFRKEWMQFFDTNELVYNITDGYHYIVGVDGAQPGTVQGGLSSHG